MMKVVVGAKRGLLVWQRERHAAEIRLMAENDVAGWRAGRVEKPEPDGRKEQGKAADISSVDQPRESARGVLAKKKDKIREMKKALKEAIESNDDGKVVSLLEDGADPDWICDDEGRSALAIAASDGSIGIMYALLECGADLETLDNWRWTALMNAVHSGKEDAVELLIDQGADVNHNASMHFENKFDISWIADDNVYRVTALNVAVSHGHADIVELLLRSGADRSVDWDCHADSYINEGSPLVVAARKGDRRMVEALLEHGADIDRMDCSDMTALTASAEMGNHEITKLLVAKGADVNIPCSSGTALRIASLAGDEEIAELLRKFGAKE